MIPLTCFFIAYLFFSPASVGQARAPSIIFDSVSVDVGKVTEGAQLRHVFNFCNEGDIPLEISRLSPT